MDESPFLKKESPVKKTLLFFESGLFEISFVLICVILFFGVLNYFNILSLSTIYPNQFGFLPHLAQNSKTSSPKTVLDSAPTPPVPKPNATVMLPKVTISDCPLESCVNAVIISGPQKEGSFVFMGLGFNNLASKKSILAVIEGELKVKNDAQSGKNVTFITISDVNKNIIFTYEFDQNSYSAISPNGKIVKQGDVIGSLTKTETVVAPTRQKFNLIIYAQSLNTQEYLYLESSSNGKTLETPTK